MVFSQTVSLEVADIEGNVSNIKFDKEGVEVLIELPNILRKFAIQIQEMQDEIDSLNLEVFQDTIEIDRLKAAVFSEPIVKDEYQIMLDFLRNNSLSAFNKEYTEREIVDIAKEVDFLPAFLKTTSGAKSEKVTYLQTLL